MDISILERFQNVRLTKEEEDIIIITIANQGSVLEECENSLIGCFLSTKMPNLQAAKTTLRAACMLGDDIRIIKVGNGMIQIKFGNEFQFQWVLDHGPWNFDNYLLLLRRWELGLTATNTKFSKAEFWIQVWGVPFDLMAKEVSKAIGTKVGRFLKVDHRTWTGDNASFLHIRVELPIENPLRCGGHVQSPKGYRVWVQFKYERLPSFCHGCAAWDTC